MNHSIFPPQDSKGNDSCLRRTWLFGLFVIFLAPLDLHNAHAQMAHLQIHRANGNLILDYNPSFSTTGASVLQFSSDPANLNIAPAASIFDVPSASNPIQLDITSLLSGSRGFFSVLEFPGFSGSEFEDSDDDPGGTEVEPDYEIETLTALPIPLVAGSTLPVHFRLRNGQTGALIPLDGSVRLGLRTGDEEPVSFPYTLSTEVLPMTAGVVDGMITLTTTASLDGVWIDVIEIIPAEGLVKAASATSIANGGSLGLQPKAVDEYRNTSPNWHYPLTALAPINGSFGEWRPSDSGGGDATSGRPHTGLDLRAEPGAAIYPAKRGVVSRINNVDTAGLLAKYLVVVHGDGSASRYLHIKPLAKVHQIVETTTILGKVANISKPHLHLELRWFVPPTPDPGSYTVLGAKPGTSYDPGLDNQAFDTPPIQRGVNDKNAPQIKALYVWGQNPKTANFAAADPGSRAINLEKGETMKALVAQIVDVGGTPDKPRYLVPCHIEFASEDAVSGVLAVRDAFDSGSESDNSDTDVKLLFQNSSQSFASFGYVRRANNAIPNTALYQYWWRWDTTGYRAYKIGPRKVRIYARDRVDQSTADLDPGAGTFTFGPKIQDGSITRAGLQYRFTNTAYIGANAFPQPDQYKLEILQTDGQPLTGVRDWTDDGLPIPKASDGQYYTAFQYIHAKPTVYSFTLPANAPTDGLKLRLSSRAMPDIAHEVCLCACGGPNMAFIREGSFKMGDVMDGIDIPVHTVYVSSFCMDRYKVSKELWDDVKVWGQNNGYSFVNPGSGKAPKHPVHTISWRDALAWCNARSEKEGLTPCYYNDAGLVTIYKSGGNTPYPKWTANGYRLPTEAEWEKAARGGASGHRFPWTDSDSISWDRANYHTHVPASQGGPAYDLNPTQGYHPTFNDGVAPYTSPVDAFAPNDYGLFGMAGNVDEWCWDLYDFDWYRKIAATQNDTRGPTGNLNGRVIRGGNCMSFAGPENLRCARRFYAVPTYAGIDLGFRCVRGF